MTLSSTITVNLTTLTHCEIDCRIAHMTSFHGVVSDIAIFVLKRDVKLQLTNSFHGARLVVS